MPQIVRESVVLMLTTLLLASTKQEPPLNRVIVSDQEIDLTSPPGDKLVGSRLGIISQLVGIPVGFEEAAEPFAQQRLRSTADLRGMTVRAALDRLVAEDPRYGWRDMNGVVVVRPVSSWSNCSHFFNRRVSVSRTDVTMTGAIALLFTLLDPSAPEAKVPPAESHGETFTLVIHDSPLLDAFNEIARAHRISWQISGAGPASDQKRMISLTLRASDGYRTGLSRELQPLPASCSK